MVSSAPILRGCGSRVAGGAYLVCPTTTVGGHPVECLLLDPAKPVDKDAIGLTAIGQLLVQDGQGLTHVMDHVGTQHYNYVSDFVEETRRYGVSRRVASTMDFTLLSPQSKLLLVHSRAVILNGADYWNGVRLEDRHACPREIAMQHCGRSIGRGHEPSRGECAGVWWHDALPEAPTEKQFLRTIGSTSYVAGPPSQAEPHMGLGIFMRCSIVRVEVVKDLESDKAERVAEHASKGSLPVVLVDD